jgi:hypothetical protein
MQTIHTLTPHAHTRVRVRTHAKKRLGGTSPSVRGKRAVPPNAYACLYPKLSGKIPKKKKVRSIPLDSPITRPQAHSHWQLHFDINTARTRRINYQTVPPGPQQKKAQATSLHSQLQATKLTCEQLPLVADYIAPINLAALPKTHLQAGTSSNQTKGLRK